MVQQQLVDMIYYYPAISGYISYFCVPWLTDRKIKFTFFRNTGFVWPPYPLCLRSYRLLPSEQIIVIIDILCSDKDIMPLLLYSQSRGSELRISVEAFVTGNKSDQVIAF